MSVREGLCAGRATNHNLAPVETTKRLSGQNSLWAWLRIIFALLVGGCILCASSKSSSCQEIPSEFFSGLNWRLIGPFRGGRAVAVSGVPGDSKTFYFGAVDGGIWKTTDTGVVWVPIFDGQPVASIGAIEVAPSNANIIYAGTGESDIRSDLASGDGVYKSDDAGKTWQNIGLRDSRQISRLVVDPQNADIVYVGVLGHAYGPNEERGVFKSTDGGANWKHVLDKGPDVGVSDLAIAAGNPQILVAGMWNARRPPWSAYGPIGGPGSGLYRSSNGGESWVQLSGHGLPDGDWGRVGVAISADGKRIYALLEAKLSGLYRSDDGGANWSLVNSDPRLTTRAWYFNSVTIDPANPDVVYVPNIALFKLGDGGKTISIVRGAPGGDDYHPLWIDPTDSSRLFLGADQGASISVDGGNTWTTWYNQPTAQFYHVITNNEFPYMVYGAQQDTGSSGVPNRTDHFQITARDWITTSATEGGYFAPDPLDPNILYDSDAYGAVERYDRRTGLSQNIEPWPVVPLASSPSSTPWASVAGASIADRKYRAPWTPMLIFSPVDKRTLYLGTQYVMTTTDGGLHWQTISPDLTGAARNRKEAGDGPSAADAREKGYGVVYAIAPSPLKQLEVWAGSDTGLIHVTLDGGKTWKDVTPKDLTAWSKVSMIEASHFAAGEAFAAIDRHQLDDDWKQDDEPGHKGLLRIQFAATSTASPARRRKPPRRSPSCSSASACSAPSATTTRSRASRRPTTTAWPRTSPRCSSRGRSSGSTTRSSTCSPAARCSTRRRARSRSRSPSARPAGPLGPDDDRREKLADWLTRPDNPYFAPSLVNRVWYHLLGRGIVEPVDDFRDTNPPSNPELLDALAEDFVKNGYRLKPLMRTILNSQHLSARQHRRPEAVGVRRRRRTAISPRPRCACCRPSRCWTPSRRRPACRRRSRAIRPGRGRIELAEGGVNHPFLQAFSKPVRDVSCECAREEDPSLPQMLHLLNNAGVLSKVKSPREPAGRRCARARTTPRWSSRSTSPRCRAGRRAAEVAIATRHIEQLRRPRRRGCRTCNYALFNLGEFLLRHRPGHMALLQQSRNQKRAAV